MLFSEPLFVFLFLPVLLALYAASPCRARNFVLLAASVAFYAWGELRFVPIMAGSILVNYAVAIWIERTRLGLWGKFALALGIVSDLSLLLYFKYTGFMLTNANYLLRSARLHTLPVPYVGLPLGISFFTFHKISYKADVYRGQAAAQRDPFDLALYILLFPQLIAGPIVRYHEIVDQLAWRARSLNTADLLVGARRFVMGLGKKMLVANVVARPVDRIMAVPTHRLTPELAWFGIVCYALQIYFDFSGYSDMAIGLARMFGFRFPENFDYPYWAVSVTDFWRRWHMSLSRWFRDYLYIPLGGNRRSTRRTYANLMTVFVLCGLWHGAAWNFLVWGLLHGAALVVERLGALSCLQRGPALVRRSYVWLFVLISWVPFRAETMSEAAGYWRAMAFAGASASPYHVTALIDSGLLIALAVGLAGSTPYPARVWTALQAWAERPAPEAAGRAGYVSGAVLARATTSAIVLAVFLLSAALMAASTYNPFIYFRF